VVLFLFNVSQVPNCECDFQIQPSNLWQGQNNLPFQIIHISTRQKITSPHTQANIYPKIDVLNCVLLLQVGSADEPVESSKQPKDLCRLYIK